MCKIAHCTAAEIAVQCEFNIKYLVMTYGETFSPHPQAGTTLPSSLSSSAAKQFIYENSFTLFVKQIKYYCWHNNKSYKLDLN